MGLPCIRRFRIGKSSRTFSMSNGTVFCIEYRLTVRKCQTWKNYFVLDVLVAVVLFWTASAGRLLLTFRYEAVSTPTGQIVAWEVELEPAAHLSLNIVDLSIT